MQSQHTLARRVGLSGVALHRGGRCAAWLQPAGPDCGVTFRSPGGVAVPAHVDHVVDVHFATSLGDGHWRVGTVEHLLAALLAAGIDNVDVVVEGDEVPALDGSAAPWVALLAEAGRVAQDAPRRRLVVTAPMEVRDGDRSARLLPSSGLEVAALIDFAHPAIGVQRLDLRLDGGTFAAELAWARTFGFLHEVDALRAAGLALGGSLDNAVVYGPDGVVNPGGALGPDEPVRHKLLDMVGDLALFGCPVQARFEAERPGHALSRKLVCATLARPECWELVVE